MYTNYHCHTKRCGHANGTEEEYIKEAIKAKIEILGFSDHGPFPDNRDSRQKSMDYSLLEEYIDSINFFKNKYDNQIKILTGLEIEYYKESSSYYESLLNRNDFDYLILGQHFFYNDSSNRIDAFNFNDTKDIIPYAKAVVEGMKTGYFKYLAHPDVVFFNNFAWDKYAEKAMDLIVMEAEKNNWILELNANGIRRGLKNFPDGIRYPYPHKKLWDKVSEAKIKVIVGSDCHKPIFMRDEAVKTAFRLAEEWNLNLVDSF